MKEVILEKIINKLADDGVINLSDLNDKTIVLSLSDINFDFCFYVNQNKMFIFDTKKSADTSITISFTTFKDLLSQKDLQDLIREDKVIIQGDIKVAQLLVDLLKQNNIKETIASMLPSGLNAQLQKFSKQVKSGELKDSIVSALIFPKIHQ